MRLDGDAWRLYGEDSWHVNEGAPPVRPELNRITIVVLRRPYGRIGLSQQRARQRCALVELPGNPTAQTSTTPIGALQLPRTSTNGPVMQRGHDRAEEGAPTARQSRTTQRFADDTLAARVGAHLQCDLICFAAIYGNATKLSAHKTLRYSRV